MTKLSITIKLAQMKNNELRPIITDKVPASILPNGMAIKERVLSIDVILPNLSEGTLICKIVKYRVPIIGIVKPLMAEYNIIREKTPVGINENNP